jgi:hypothetical protein
MNQKEAIPPITAAMGAPAFEIWRREKFQPRGLWKVIGWARAAESGSRYAKACASAETLRKAVAELEEGSIERMRADRELAQMMEKVSAYSVEALSAIAGTFAGHDALCLLRDDLLRMVADTENLLEEICAAYRAMHKKQGWPEPDAAYVSASSALHQAASDFLHCHLRPALAQFEEEFSNSDRGTGISRAFQPESAAWILCGCDWRGATGAR